MLLHRTCLLAIACFLLAGCSKHESIPSQSEYAFTNGTTVRLNLDFYASQADYASSQNRVGQYHIEPGATQTIPLTPLNTVWLDWYSDNYAFNNWQSANSGFNRNSPTPQLKVAIENDHFTLNSNSRDTTRSVLLNGSGASSRWRGTAISTGDIYDFIFRKDFTGTYSQTTGGNVISGGFNYGVTSVTNLSLGQGRFTVTLTSSQSGSSQSSIFQATFSSSIFGSQWTGRDTLTIRNLLSSTGDFYVRRQP